MLTPHPPHPPYQPDPEPVRRASDPSLAASLKAPSWAVDPYPLEALLRRHWQPVQDYAALRAAAGSQASALAAAAVHQVLRGLERSGPTAALRPRLLMAVRDVAEAWAAERDGCAPPHNSSDPSLPAASGVRSTRQQSAASEPDDDRRLALLSFWSMRPTAQCLLWHTAVEAEPLSAPAALLALDIGTALTELQQARSQFRSGLVHAHEELAAHAVCRFYGRLLGARDQRAGAFPPDVRHHLLSCAHCRAAAVQLRLFDERLGLLLAQAVLGAPADAYLASRPGRQPPARAPGPGRPPAPRSGRGRRPGRHRLVDAALPCRAALPVRVPVRTLLAGVGLASAFALGAVLTATLWPPGGADAEPAGGDGAGTATRTESGEPDADVLPHADGGQGAGAPPAPAPTPALFRTGGQRPGASPGSGPDTLCPGPDAL